MTAIQLKHTNSADILFPEESVHLTLDDSFYSQPSTSNYSSYSQEVKYIFNPKVASRSQPSQSEYSEIDHLSMVNSIRHSAEMGKEPRRDINSNTKWSPSSQTGSSPGGGITTHGHVISNGPSLPPRGPSMDPIHDAKYGLSIKPVRYPQHHKSVDSLNYVQHSTISESLKPSQRHNSTDSFQHVQQSPRTNYDNHNSYVQSWQKRSDSSTPVRPVQSVQTGHRPPPHRSLSSDSAHRQERYPPRNGSAPNPKTPPKPRRLHQMTVSPPDKDSTKHSTSQQEIYATPVLNASVLKNRSQNTPLPPPPPPYSTPRVPQNGVPAPVAQINQVKAVDMDFDSMAARRRTWSPPMFNRMMANNQGSQLQAMRCYRSNEQLDSIGHDNTYEDLETVSNVSNASAPPKITPQSGKLNKYPHERIIKPIAFKPIITPQTRYSGTGTPPKPLSASSQRPSPPSALRPSPLQAFPMSPHQAGASEQTPLRHNHSQDDGYISSHDGNHSNSGTSNLHGNQSLSQGSIKTSEMNVPVDRSEQFSERSAVHQLPFSPISSQNHSQSYAGSQQNGSHGYYKSSGSESYTSSNVSRVSSNPGVDVSMTTPSPSDSGVVEMEAIMRSKDAEIQQLRETLEKNETAILQVCEEKRQNWHLEMRDYAQEWDQRLRSQQQKAFKTEQALLMQLFRLQQERKSLRLESEQHKGERDKVEKHCSEVSAELSKYKSKCEELEWDVQHKMGEVGHLKTQLKDAKEDATIKTTDLFGLRSQIKDLSLERQKKSDDIQMLTEQLNQAREDFRKLQDKLDSSQTELDETKQALSTQKQTATDNLKKNDTRSVLEAELSKVRSELKSVQDMFVHDREQWLDEKNKVVRYQKHLQLNYVQMMRKNKMLEAEMEQLTLELENRDIKLMTDGVHLTEEESVC